MITRIWQGKTLAKHAEKYLDYLRETGMEDYQNTKGNLSAKILRNITGDICHFWVITEWVDIQSIKNYAGPDFERAKYYPLDERYLLHLEEKVEHFETFTY